MHIPSAHHHLILRSSILLLHFTSFRISRLILKILARKNCRSQISVIEIYYLSINLPLYHIDSILSFFSSFSSIIFLILVVVRLVMMIRMINRKSLNHNRDRSSRMCIILFFLTCCWWVGILNFFINQWNKTNHWMISLIYSKFIFLIKFGFIDRFV